MILNVSSFSPFHSVGVSPASRHTLPGSGPESPCFIFCTQYWESSGEILILWCYMAFLVFSGQKVHGGGNWEFTPLSRWEFHLQCVSNSRQPLPLPLRPPVGKHTPPRPSSGAMAGDFFVGSPSGKRCIVWKSCIFMVGLQIANQNTWGMSSRANLSGGTPRGPESVDLG